jgi:phage recombination protein Bet
MGTASLVTTQRENRLAMPAPEYSTEQIKLLAETVAKGCDQNELAFFLQVAKLKRLDPFTGQIHVVKRWDSSLGKEKISIQTGVDGYRAIASRTGDLAGIDDPEYDSEVEEHPNWSKITVYRYGRGDEKVPYRATARWGEYVQTYKDKQTGELKPNPMWKRMPYLMLGKVAESLALRKAFPDELSGMYTNEEMGQADNETPGVTPNSVMGKPQVQMPKSTDEKKPPVQTGKAETTQQFGPPEGANARGPSYDPSKESTKGQQTQQVASQGKQDVKGVTEISGEITNAKLGTGTAEEILFLVVDGKVVSVPKHLIDAEMVVGAKVLITATKRTVGKTDQYMTSTVEMLVAPVQEGEVIDAEYEDVKPTEEKREPGQPDPILEEYRAAGLGGIFDDAPPKAKVEENVGTPEPTPTTATKPGKIGPKRAQRLYAIRGQNWKNTGLTEAIFKKILLSLPIPVEHLSDLEIGMYETMEKICTGEDDWKNYVDD